MELREVPLDSISADGRFERDYGDMEELVESLKRYGLLQPIVITRDMQLVAGGRRMAAARSAGWLSIPAVYQDDLDEYTRRCMELEENIQRKNLSWDEEQEQLAELHRLREAADPSWTQERTAELSGKQQSRVAEALKLTGMMKLFPELRKAKSRNQAMSWMKQKAKSVLRVKEVSDHAPDFTNIEQRIVHGDSVEVIKTIPDESYHLVLTDPPFGISYDHRKAGTEGAVSAYEDSAESYERLLSMAPDIYRVLKRDAWLVWFLGPTWYERAKQVFRSAGFTVDEIPIIWDRSEGRTFTTRPDRYFGRAYDMALHALKGDPEMTQYGRSKPNILRFAPVSTSDRELLVERPVELYEELIKRLVYRGETVADFFVGSGSVLAAAAASGCDFFGVEQDIERRAVALKKVRAYVSTEE